MNKVKSLKREVHDSDDDEKIKYLKLALQSVNEEIRILMEGYYNKK